MASGQANDLEKPGSLNRPLPIPDANLDPATRRAHIEAQVEDLITPYRIAAEATDSDASTAPGPVTETPVATEIVDYEIRGNNMSGSGGNNQRSNGDGYSGAITGPVGYQPGAWQWPQWFEVNAGAQPPGVPVNCGYFYWPFNPLIAGYPVTPWFGASAFVFPWMAGGDVNGLSIPAVPQAIAPVSQASGSVTGGSAGGPHPTESPQCQETIHALNVLSESLDTPEDVQMASNSNGTEQIGQKGSYALYSANVINASAKDNSISTKETGRVATTKRAKEHRKMLAGDPASSLDVVKPAAMTKKSPRRGCRGSGRSRDLQWNSENKRGSPLSQACLVPWAASMGLTVEKIEGEFAKSRSNVHREKIICRLLDVQRPKYRITSTPGRKGQGSFDAEVCFSSPPFLQSFGVFASMVEMKTSKEVVEEACAGKTVDFLLSMIQKEGKERPSLELAGERKDTCLIAAKAPFLASVSVNRPTQASSTLSSSPGSRTTYHSTLRPRRAEPK